jgi:tetrahydromethanopterin S-methyltransferase subunit A
MIPDPAGYFVVYVDRRRNLLSLEHYSKDGVLHTVIEGDSAAKLYIPAIEKSLVSRLDHAAYLGKELARAERALRMGEPYIQDGAPEAPSLLVTAGCGCGSACEGGQQ